MSDSTRPATRRVKVNDDIINVQRALHAQCVRSLLAC